jgi:hypothetical protein
MGLAIDFSVPCNRKSVKKVINKVINWGELLPLEFASPPLAELPHSEPLNYHFPFFEVLPDCWLKNIPLLP